VVIFLETAELRTKSRQPIPMAFWRENVGQLIVSNGFQLLTHAGSISQAQMEQITSARYGDFDERRREREAIEADQADEAELKALEQRLNRRPKS
jgi:hypothetical protein